MRCARRAINLNSAATILLGMMSGAASCEELDSRRVLEEAVPRLAQLESQLRDSICRGRYTESRPEKVKELAVQYIRRADHCAILSGGLGDDRKEAPLAAPLLVQCYTSKYAFRLSRSHPSSPWTINSFTDDPKIMERERTIRHGTLDLLVLGTCTLGGRSFGQLLKAPGLKLGPARRLSDGTNRIEITFQVLGSTLSVDSGSFVLNPDLGWSVASFDIRELEKNGVTRIEQGQMEARRSEDGMFLPEHVVVRMSHIHPGRQDPKWFYTEEVRFVDICLGCARDEHFTLPGYGLPDIPLHPSRAVSFFSFGNGYLWISLILAVLAFVLLHYGRRVSGSGSGGKVPTG